MSMSVVSFVMVNIVMVWVLVFGMGNSFVVRREGEVCSGEDAWCFGVV